jgi:hypothetical protein
VMESQTPQLLHQVCKPSAGYDPLMRIIVLALALVLGIVVAAYSGDRSCHFHCGLLDLVRLLFAIGEDR